MKTTRRTFLGIVGTAALTCAGIKIDLKDEVGGYVVLHGPSDARLEIKNGDPLLSKDPKGGMSKLEFTTLKEPMTFDSVSVTDLDGKVIHPRRVFGQSVIVTKDHSLTIVWA